MFHRDGGIEEVRGEIKHLEMASGAFAAPPNGLLTFSKIEAPSGCSQKVVVYTGLVQQGKKTLQYFNL